MQIPRTPDYSEPQGSTALHANLGLTKHAAKTPRDKVWIDLDNSPHVPFFAPIIEELESRGYSVLLTARDCFQVCELAELLHLNYKKVGHHYGKNLLLKALGLCIRAAQLLPLVVRQKPSLAVSHGSRSQLVVASLLGIPSVTMGDYEFAKLFAVIRPDWLIVPQVIPDDAVKGFKGRVLKYPGIKEEVYAPRFKPQDDIMQQLGLNDKNLIVTIRPPATEAHYHVHETEELFDEVLDYLGDRPDLKIILLPRNRRQANAIRASRPELFRAKRMIIPEVVDGMNLIWHSDLVISGGGTMNREAAALGVPVYSIFRGKIGAVDRHLAANGRLTLIESREDVRRKLVLRHRQRRMEPTRGTSPTLEKVVEHIVSIVEGAC